MQSGCIYFAVHFRQLIYLEEGREQALRTSGNLPPAERCQYLPERER
ncbi:hypothetical protein ADIS_0526 [Lunatimonas lonarensis]|uniref:Uncharacterized protein n=1 Tax=Lunatimonas lonarensis TaxID=1232681 RepID=R7ZY38_9BACT|nr:hypothetical protein ADIS_0526 [Lunatimonas lonarensis]